MSDILHNVEVVKNKICDAAKGRDVTLVAVSKTADCEKILEAHSAGVHIFGENKMQELVEKSQIIKSPDIKWHFIGKLQSNKIKYLENHVALLQSIDSFKLCESIENKINSRKDALIQINIGEEAQKNGFLEKNFLKGLESFEKFSKINIIGLMCIPPKENSSVYFSRMHDIFKKVNDMQMKNMNMQYLSMGMSADYEQAVAHGSNMVRVGSSIFGKRL